ncbi:hypothetical protein M408DRAFT_325670 [Serendipita vermifera MAFF 305830]|uniref:J domain-containing protein n=1 Tax=Serendipita vermifera MAFF 305830 TaxID=933852 RepID=A0A0C3BQ44_SERVB|nr:hypothetical protein M408DRAFT_325670 [Serendipita vermifera MAFF 305830]
MPRRFFRFPSKDQEVSPNHYPPSHQPPPPPPKVDPKNISSPFPLNDTIRSRRVTSPPRPQIHFAAPKTAASRLPHRASASDSFAQGSAWRVPGAPEAPTKRESTVPPRAPPAPEAGFKRPLRRSKGHQPIAEEKERRTKQAETLLKEQTKLKKEIDEETIRLTYIRQQQEALRNEREKVEQEKARAFHPQPENTNANRYGQSQSTPILNDWTPYSRGRSTAQSQESFRSTSSQEPDYRRVWSRTPSVSSNDRSPPPPPGSHWQKVEQARKERERERAIQKLSETRALEKKAFEEAWSIYESRWMLLAFATRSVATYTSETQHAPGHLTLSFHDIPWPLLHPARSSHDITAESIRRFLASEHHSIDRTHRERIKEALLRWHPDRFGSRVLDHVREAQRDEVRKGVDIVVRCLNELLSKV